MAQTSIWWRAGRAIVAAAILPSLLTACSPPSTRDAGVLARVGAVIITEDNFRSELERRARLEPGRFDGIEARRKVLDELVAFEAMHQKALAAGYAESAEFRQKVRRWMVARYEEDQLAAAGPVAVAPGEIETFYQQHGEAYGTPARLRVAVIRVSCPRTASAEQRERLQAQAELARSEAVTQATNRSAFGQIAQKHSDHQGSRYRGGEIGWWQIGGRIAGWPDEVVAAAAALNAPGALSPVVSAPDGFYVVKLLEREAAGRRPLEQVRAGIEHKLRLEQEQARARAVHAAALQGLDVRVDERRLAAVTPPASPAKSPPSLTGRPLAKVHNP